MYTGDQVDRGNEYSVAKQVCLLTSGKHFGFVCRCLSMRCILPQDMVVEFAKMNMHQRLEETELAVSNGNAIW